VGGDTFLFSASLDRDRLEGIEEPANRSSPKRRNALKGLRR